jgi:hypothetical protein
MRKNEIIDSWKTSHGFIIMKVSDGDRLFYISTDFEWMRVEN